MPLPHIQDETTRTCRKYLTRPDVLVFDKPNHIQYLYRGINGLSRGYTSLDASQPWLLYWIFNSLDLLGEDISPYTDKYFNPLSDVF